MSKQIISSPLAPDAIGPYSHAVKAGEFLFVSGQVGVDPATGEFAGPDTADQTEQCLKNLSAILSEAGAGLEQVFKTTVFLADLDDFQVMNQVYSRFFSADPPARACVKVARLPRGARVEIELVAHLAA
ncbi:RidA family protein [Desulfoferula mesophila]|uniref:Reactive intermediate/imine deaminase n=1 Tax=Desulfoferula mesophila TaxID=3058419 RepID=A0AAU9EHN5_9BACT|nr:reactive intermediate/imine deaminase [Desulfoferula mesophilus]